MLSWSLWASHETHDTTHIFVSCQITSSQESVESRQTNNRPHRKERNNGHQKGAELLKKFPTDK